MRHAPDGELTGPFAKPRAGPPLVRILFPALVPSVAALLQRPGLWSVAGGYALLMAGTAVMVLIGQRMPLLLTGLGLVTVALLLPRLRPAMLVSVVLAALLVAASPVIAPEAHHRLVSKFSRQMENFSTSQYGELYARALEIGVQNPFTGLGAVGVRLWLRAAALFPAELRWQPEGWRRRGDLLAPSAQLSISRRWPSGGFVGLALFVWLAFAWLAAMARALMRRPDPVLVGLFAAALIQLWPIASTTGFFTLPVAGWSFLLLGWGMAEARWGASGAPVADQDTASYIPRDRKSELG